MLRHKSSYEVWYKGYINVSHKQKKELDLLVAESNSVLYFIWCHVYFNVWRDFIWTQPKKPKPCLHNDQLFHSWKCEVHHVTKTCFCYCFALQQWLRLTHISLILHKTRLAKVIFEDFTKWSVLIEIGDWFRWENGKKLKNENL